MVITNCAEMNTTYAHGEDVGIDGIKIRDNYLYWVKQDNGGVYKMKIDNKGYAVSPGIPETVTVENTYWDDFAFGPKSADSI